MFEQCASLSPEQLDARIAGSYGTIFETLHHIVTSEQSYFSRISLGRRVVRPETEAPMSFPEMLESLKKTGEGLIEWASKVKAEDTVTVDWDGTPRNVPKTILLTQVINHATEHREQVKAILTELGIEPLDLQAWEYFHQMDV